MYMTVCFKPFRERYRDLIEAADTITEMKNSAQNVRILQNTEYMQILVLIKQLPGINWHGPVNSMKSLQIPISVHTSDDLLRKKSSTFDRVQYNLIKILYFTIICSLI